MATTASRFRPHGPSRQITMPTAKDNQIAVPGLDSEVIDPPPVPVRRGAAVEFETRFPPSGNVTIVSGRQAVTVRQGMAGRTLTIWADLHSVHLVLDGHVLRIVASRLLPQDLAFLALRGARPAGPPPASAAIQRRGCTPVIQAVEVDRKVHLDRHVFIDGGKYQVGAGPAGTTVTMWLDGHLMHAIADGALAGTWPCPITAERGARLAGVRAAATPLPPRRRASQAIRPGGPGRPGGYPQAVLFRPVGSYFGVGLSRNTSVSAFIDATVAVESGSASIRSPRIRT